MLTASGSIPAPARGLIVRQRALTRKFLCAARHIGNIEEMVGPDGFEPSTNGL